MDVETERRRLSQVFDDVAELYDEVRPRYPEPLVERILEVSGIGPAGRIVEIGAGPGKATLPFARRGYVMTCLEPGPALAARLAEHVAPYPRVLVEVARFEDWQLPEEPYDLLISGQAFHWVDPAVAYQKSANALRPGGWMATFWNKPVPEAEAEPMHGAILEAYREHAPHLIERGGKSITSHGDPAERIAESGRFDPALREVFPWQARHTPDHYTRLLRTHSDHRALAPAVLDRLVDGVARVIEREGGVFTVDHIAELYMARRAA